jgi:glycosyltransferase involved in cell wall biosynthesis
VTSTRVLVVFSTLAVGGAERQLAWLVPGLQARGFEVLVATLRERGRYFDQLRDAGIRTAHVAMRSRTDVRGLVRAFRLWRTHPALVLTQSVDAQVIGQAIARRAGAAHVTIEQGGPGIHTSRRRMILIGLVAPRVDRVICVSRSQVPELRRLGYRTASIRVVPNGSAEPVTTRRPEETRRELGLQQADCVALLVASLRPEKRPDVFLEAVRRATTVEPCIRGLVAGGGPLLDEIRRSASVNGDVAVLGERSDVADLMACADIVCLSSDVEGIPLAVVEAMALGRPVVATDVGGLRELVDPPRTGVLVPPNDPASFSAAIVDLARAPEAREAMGASAHDRFRANFTAELMVDRYANVLAEALEARDQTARPR